MDSAPPIHWAAHLHVARWPRTARLPRSPPVASIGSPQWRNASSSAGHGPGTVESGRLCEPMRTSQTKTLENWCRALWNFLGLQSVSLRTLTTRSLARSIVLVVWSGWCCLLLPNYRWYRTSGSGLGAPCCKQPASLVAEAPA